MENLTHCPISSPPSYHKKGSKLLPVGPTRKKKPDPNAPKITRPCTECGKRFWSWKALFGHMRCHPDRHWRGINPPPANLLPTLAEESGKGVAEEEREVAACLLMLANGRREVENKLVNPISAAKFEISSADQDYKLVVDSRYKNNSTNNNANFKISSVDADCKLVANSRYKISSINNSVSPYYSTTNSDIMSLGYDISSTNIGLYPNVSFNDTVYGSVTDLGDNIGFDCLTSKKVKVFGSHQAKKKKVGCFAVRHASGDDMAEDGGGREGREVVALGHKCGVCLRVFSSGQALGGHMRCHFEKGGLNCLDLNLPPPIEDYRDFNNTFSCFSTGVALDLRLGI